MSLEDVGLCFVECAWIIFPPGEGDALMRRRFRVFSFDCIFGVDMLWGSRAVFCRMCSEITFSRYGCLLVAKMCSPTIPVPVSSVSLPLFCNTFAL